MNKTDAILNKGQKLYEDDAYILLWTKFFGLSLLALTSYYVYDKQKQRLIKLMSREKNLSDEHQLLPHPRLWFYPDNGVGRYQFI